MHRAFVDKKWLLEHKDKKIITLTHELSKRFVKILRIRPQEEVALFDGYGHELRGFIKNNNLINAKFYVFDKPKPQIILLQAALKEDKICETFKRGTEFGIDKFIIFNSQRSDKYCYEKISKRQERFKNLNIDASRQSGRYFVPDISFSSSLDQSLAGLSSNNLGFFGKPNSLNSLLEKSQELFNTDIQTIYLIIGPEGGLSEEEENIAISKKFIDVTFSPYVLRTELACLAAVSILHGVIAK